MNEKFIVITALTAMTAFASPAPSIPGTELDNKTYFEYFTAKNKEQNPVVHDSASQTAEAEIRDASFSWGAPPIYDQIARDTTHIKYGMGAVFVPKMSGAENTEPTFRIYNSGYDIVAHGEPGKKVNLAPGIYELLIMSNTPFEITQEFEIKENEITPILPTWACIRIDVVDENGKPIRGEYDLAMVNPLAYIGRGRGRDADLAEELRVWYLPKGLYKILAVGSALNSISNFLTFRLPIAGEYIRFTVVQEEEGGKILGGGILFENSANLKKDRYWQHSISVGGSMDFSYQKDDFADTVSNLTNFSVLIYDRLSYTKNKLEFMNLARIDAGFIVEDVDFNRIRAADDEFREYALFTYRLFKRMGPYWRGEFVSSVFPKTADFTANNRIGQVQNYRHTFINFDKAPDTIGDNSNAVIDSVSLSKSVSPAFSPILLRVGAGFNMHVVKSRVFNAHFLSGFGVDYESRWDSWRILAEKNLYFDTASVIYKTIYDTDINRITLERNNGQRLDYGPEFVLNASLYISKYISLDGDVRLFLPITRISTPDVRLHNLLSFHPISWLSLDYDYRFELIQSKEENLRSKTNKHRVLARFSFAKR
jgi:hypothetical protein